MNLLNPVLSLLFPVFCGVCSANVEQFKDGVACGQCWDQTRLLNGNPTICHKCGRFHSDSSRETLTFCRQCDDDFYDTARACGFYEKALAATILSLKTTPNLAKRPANLLMDCYVSGPFCEVDIVVPVPLSGKRMLERGFNQALVIARSFSKQSGVPVDSYSLIRNKHTEVSRAALDKKGRAMTVRNAFSVRRSNLIRNKNILLIDDVFTSGATCSMAAKALKKSGAAKVDVLTLARAGARVDG